MKGLNDRIKGEKVMQMKMEKPIKERFPNLPEELYEYMDYVKKLEYTETPDYDYLIKLFSDLMKK